MNLLRASANRLSACGRALRPWLWRTLLPAAVLDPSGQASPAERQPCRMAVARFTAARALGRARRRAWSAVGGQIGNTGTFLGKPRRNGRACGRQYLRSAICATRSKGPRGPTVGYDHTGHSISLACPRGLLPQPVQGADRPLRPYGSAHVRPGLAMDTNYSD